MSDLLALCFDSVTEPVISLNRSRPAEPDPGQMENARGWGFGWYPGEELAGQVLKDPEATGEDKTMDVLRDWNRFGSTIFICHFRGQAQHRAQSDAQPFLHHYSGRSWIIAHSGTLRDDWRSALPLGDKPSFEPVGRTDTEHIFCWLLNRFQREEARSLGGYQWERLTKDLRMLNESGPLNLMLSDGQSLAVYQCREAQHPIYWSRRIPPHGHATMANSVLSLTIEQHQAHHTYLAFATEPLSDDSWVQMSPGQLLITRRGKIIWDSLGVWDQQEGLSQLKLQSAASGEFDKVELYPPLAAPGSETEQAPSAAQSATPEKPAGKEDWRLHWRIGPSAQSGDEEYRFLRIFHESRYRYDNPVRASHHILRLQPLQDGQQSLEEFDLRINVDGKVHRFEDVFGNQTIELDVTRPFTEFLVRSESRVRLGRTFPLEERAPHRREQIPLVWMPWQRQMMLAYLLPTELPESHLTEIFDFSMSFVERNDYNLRDLLLDMNRTIFHDFEYVPGVTTLETTPYDVLIRRKGVCQDFANLLICMARLLSIPARYRVGYIDTLATSDNQVQSESSHAWAELYLPGAGWVGFDPTNGKLVKQEHVRVACGRNYRDATPTMGTLYKGGAGETLEVTVKVEPET